ncbi:MAG: hypothetical protein H7233_08450 [Pseudorhodobacter sp.]|nr:hypothetical protein [Frankiaceae bacterium]
MPVTESSSVKNMDVVDWGDLGREMWDYLTDKGAAINYRFVNLTVEVRATPASRLRGRPESWVARCGSPEENAGKPSGCRSPHAWCQAPPRGAGRVS